MIRSAANRVLTTTRSAGKAAGQSLGLPTAMTAARTRGMLPQPGSSRRLSSAADGGAKSGAGAAVSFDRLQNQCLACRILSAVMAGHFASALYSLCWNQHHAFTTACLVVIARRKRVDPRSLRLLPALLSVASWCLTLCPTQFCASLLRRLRRTLAPLSAGRA